MLGQLHTLTILLFCLFFFSQMIHMSFDLQLLIVLVVSSFFSYGESNTDDVVIYTKMLNFLQWYFLNSGLLILQLRLICRKHFPVLSSFTTYYRVCNQINTTGATSRAGTAYPSGEPEYTPGFQWSSCYSIFSFICMFCRSLFVLWYFFFWPLCCLFFFDIRFLIAPLVSSNSS